MIRTVQGFSGTWMSESALNSRQKTAPSTRRSKVPLRTRLTPKTTSAPVACIWAEKLASQKAADVERQLATVNEAEKQRSEAEKRRTEAEKKRTEAERNAEEKELAAATGLRFTEDPDDIADCNVYIVTTPTPIDAAKQPDLSPVLSATQTIAEVLRPGDTVILDNLHVH